MSKYAGYSDQLSGNALIRLIVDDSELKDGLKSASGKLERFSMQLFSIGRNMETIGQQLAAPFQAAAKVFADFDDQMRRVAAVTGASEGKLSKLTDTARRLGASTAFTASQVAQGMGALGMMGFSSSEIDGAIEGVMNLSTATSTELAEAASIAANQLRVFNLQASETGSVADVLAATANGSSQTLTDLGEALSKAGPFAAQAGMSLRETSAAIGVLANMGIRGSIAGTALATSVKRMTDPAIQKTLKTVYGIDATDGAGNLRSMAQIWKDLGAALSQMGNSQRIAAITDIFGDRGALGGGQLTFNGKAIDDFLNKLREADGYTARAAKGMEGGLGGALRSLSSAAEAVGISVGNALAPALSAMEQAAAAVLRMVAKLIDAFGEFVPVAAVLSTATLGIGVSLKTVSVAMSVIGKMKAVIMPDMLKAMAGAYNKLALEIWYHGTACKEAVVANGIFSASMQGLKVATLAVGTAIKKLWAVVLAHPFAAVAAAVYLAVKALTYFQDKAADARIAQSADDTAAALKKIQNAQKQAESSNAGLQSSFDRLRQLAEMAELGASQQAEYNSIMAQFAAAGIDVGASFDGASKKIALAANATELFNGQLQEIRRLSSHQRRHHPHCKLLCFVIESRSPVDMRFCGLLPYVIHHTSPR